MDIFVSRASLRQVMPKQCSMCMQIMGLGFVFRLDESSLAGHVGERAPRTAADTESVAITEAGSTTGYMSHLTATAAESFASILQRQYT